MASAGPSDTIHRLWMELFSPQQRQQQRLDDGAAWRRVIAVLITVVSVGTLMMALAVLACL